MELTYPGKIFTRYSGLISIRDPKWQDINIMDISWSLSHLCRFTGHTSIFYSVAEHCCIVHDNVPKEHRLWGLMHDATEAYLGDVSRPLKDMLPEYRVLEDRMMATICERFEMDPKMPPIVGEWDNTVLKWEIAKLINSCQDFETHRNDLAIEGWDPHRARHEFLKRFWALLGQTS